MKTILPTAIRSTAAAENYLTELHKNGELYHCEDDAHEQTWSDLPQSQCPTIDECDHLNKLMEQVHKHLPDPCDFCMTLITMEEDEKVFYYIERPDASVRVIVSDTRKTFVDYPIKEIKTIPAKSEDHAIEKLNINHHEEISEGEADFPDEKEFFIAPKTIKHTAGPWYIVTAYKNGDTMPQDALAIADKKVSPQTNDMVCLISPVHLITERDEANAKVIVQAPQMLKLLTEMVQYETDGAFRAHADKHFDEETGGNVTAMDAMIIRAQKLIQLATTK